jgi:hypothetical protein
MSSPGAATSTAVEPKLEKEARASSEVEAATARMLESPYEAG